MSSALALMISTLALLSLPAAPASSATPGPSGSWQPAGSNSTPRAAHTASLIANGRVLVAGGATDVGGGAVFASTELFDPVSGWSAGPSMATARFSHTATVLGNGTVLVTGGLGATGPLSSTEIYDPPSGTWSAGPSMNAARGRAVAALLGNGRVLVAGGEGGGVLGTAELYDPNSRSWSTTSMTEARVLPTITVLGDGRVLLTGGRGAGGAPLATSEIFDPAGGTWTQAAPLPSPRADHAAVLLPQGSVLVAGGSGSAGCPPGDATTFTYDPANNAWSAAGAMGIARGTFTLTALRDGRALAAGGPCDPTTRATDIYDPSTRTWASAGDMTVSDRRLATATRLADGRVLVVGGEDQTLHNAALAELYTASALLGDDAIEATPDPSPVGMPEANQFFATASASTNRLWIYIDGTNRATSLELGIYSDNAGVPGSLLGGGRLTVVQRSAWNAVTIPAVTLTSGSAYWIARLAVAGGSLITRIDATATNRDRVDTRSSSTLPATFSPGASYPHRTSMYAEATSSGPPPDPTPTPPPTPTPTPGQTRVTFDDLANPNRGLNGSYAGINWGSGSWYLSSPWGQFTTNSVSYPTAGPTSASLTFTAPSTLVSIDAYNGGNIASTVTLTCTGSTTVSRTVAVGQLVTITTGWSATCTTLVIGSTNGWDTNFDNVVYNR